MNITERHEFITREVEAKGQVSVTELSVLLNVSEVTIRKDLTPVQKGLSGAVGFIVGGDGVCLSLGKGKR